MKKLITIMVLAFVAFNLQAQNLSFGPTAGFGHSWTSADLGSSKSKFHPYYNIGGKMVYSFVTSWGISGDIRFSSEGQTVDAGSATYSARANYIRVPLQGIYFFGKYGDRVRPKISIGPSFGFLVGGKTDAVLGEVKTTDYWKTFDFGFTGAAGANVRIAPATWLNLDLAYYHGFSDVPEDGTSAKNRNIGVNVGVTFPVATVMPDKIRN